MKDDKESFLILQLRLNHVRNMLYQRGKIGGGNSLEYKYFGTNSASSMQMFFIEFDV